MSLPFRAQGRSPDEDNWQKLGRFRTVREAKDVADAFEARTGGEARVRGHAGEIIKFITSELTPEGRERMAKVIRDNPEGLAPGVSVEDALRLLRGEGPPPNGPGGLSNKL
jgi:hypothetical protein